MSKAKREKIKNLSPDTPIDECPDCQMKYDKIFKKANEEPNWKFSDVEFDHENEEKVLGDRITKAIPGVPAMRNIRGWKRASEIEGTCLYKDGAHYRDVTQGMLGDCYFLSAIGVLGDKRVKDVIISEQDEMENWKKTGCFMLRFFKDGNPEYIIVDDWLPVDSSGKFAFTNGGTDGKEIWPCILEKGYAKLYGSYSFIEAGKISMAVSDMTENGFPEEIKLELLRSNRNLFEGTLRKLAKAKALMGAGSPEHEMGDRAVSSQGIVYGHAYAVLQVMEYNNTMLV